MLSQLRQRSAGSKTLLVRTLANSSYVFHDGDIETYKKQGFLLVKGQVCKERVDFYNKRFKDVVEGFVLCIQINSKFRLIIIKLKNCLT